MSNHEEVPEVLGEFVAEASAFDGDSFTPKEHDGELVLIYPHSIEKDITTDYGITDATKAKVILLDGPEKGEEFNDALLFSGPLQRDLAKYVGTGQGRLGRIRKEQFKNGRSGWKLSTATEEEVATANAYVKSRKAAAQVSNDIPPF